MTALPQPINLFEFEQFAKERLPKEEYDYIAGGATDEISVDRNHRAFASWALRPRVLRDVSALDLSTTVLGTKVSLPVLLPAWLLAPPPRPASKPAMQASFHPGRPSRRRCRDHP